MPKFRKKPVVVEAILWSGENMDEILVFTGLKEITDRTKVITNTLIIQTLEGDMRAQIGDWIIKGVNGEFYPCKPDIFKKTYELIN